MMNAVLMRFTAAVRHFMQHRLQIAQKLRKAQMKTQAKKLKIIFKNIILISVQ